MNTLIHKDFRQRSDIRYIKKTMQTALSVDDYTTLIAAIRKGGALPCATPFDETSVDLCVTLGVQIIKLASSDLNDWFLIEKIAKTRKPVIASTGKRVFLSSGTLLTLPGITSTKGQSDQSMPPS